MNGTGRRFEFTDQTQARLSLRRLRGEGGQICAGEGLIPVHSGAASYAIWQGR
jgi:hypothetical protein